MNKYKSFMFEIYQKSFNDIIEPYLIAKLNKEYDNCLFDDILNAIPYSTKFEPIDSTGIVSFTMFKVIDKELYMVTIPVCKIKNQKVIDIIPPQTIENN